MLGAGSDSLTEPAKLLLLASLLAKDRIITENGKAFLKELILRRDPRLLLLLQAFETKDTQDAAFLDTIYRLIEEEAYRLYTELFAECSLETGKHLSKAEREQNQLTDVKSLIYGEVDFHSFARVLRKINPKPGCVFYDLGSGTAKAVFVARFMHDFSATLGIEILGSLDTAAQVVVERFNGGGFRPMLNTAFSQDVKCMKGSFLNDCPWDDGDVIFANSTCFDDELMEGMSREAGKLKPGAFFITFTKGLSSEKFEVLERKRYKMSWGPATVFIHRRLNHDGSSAAGTLTEIADDDSYNEYDDAENDDDEDDDEDEDDPDDDDDDEIDDDVDDDDEDDGEDDDDDE